MTRPATIERKRKFLADLYRRQCSLGYFIVFVTAGLTGCHHRRAQPVLLPPQTPVALVPVPEPDAPLVETQTPKLPAVPIAQSDGKPKKVKKRTPKAAATAQSQPAAANPSTPNKKPVEKAAEKPAEKPAEAASASAPAKSDAVAGIGALTVGGEQSPRALQEATELLAANERRLVALSGNATKAQVDLVGKVRNFQKDAQVALTSGDAEGAKTLATKGKLLLDDLDKGDAK